MTDFNQKTHDTDVGSHGGQSRQMMEVFENQEFGSIRLLQEAGKTLDDGEPCVCVQSISLSLMCRWFRVAVLPLDGELAAALLYRGSRKRCAVCGAAFVPKSNRGKYCPDCAGRMKKIKAAERKRKQRQRCHALEPFKPA